MRNIVTKPTQSDTFLENLILQRTGPFIRLGGGAVLNEWFATGNKSNLLKFLKIKNLVTSYWDLVIEELVRELTVLQSYVPNEILCRVVSVGPGNGLFELLLLQKNLTSAMLLVDTEDTGAHYHGYHEQGSGYANLSDTNEFISSNLDVKVDISLCNPLKEPLPDFRFSLFLSLLSMGFHYPCRDYIEFIMRNSFIDSFVVLDKRCNVVDSDFNYLLDNFEKVFSIPSDKSDRVILRRVR
jgi:hypothetical protein